MRSRAEAATVICRRHPTATSHHGHCAACLLEEALAPEPGPAPQPEGNAITIQVPLGASPASSVFLVKTNLPAVRLLRLKTWRITAPRDFMTRVQRLQQQLAEWNEAAVPSPLAACVDALGQPSVLTDFNQGVPIVQRVQSGGLDPMDAVTCLKTLLTLTLRAHERGLVHGAIVSSNIIVGARGDRPYLLDFGHAVLIRPEGMGPPEAAADVAGFYRLIHAVRALTSDRSPRQ